MKTLFSYMIGAAGFDVKTYEQVEVDRGSTAAAVFIVIAASLAAALGSGARDMSSLLGVTMVLLMTWVVWVVLTYIIGTRLLPEPQTHADWGELLRTTGFSASPGVLRLLGLIPGLALPVFFAITIWMLLTFIVAVRQALDYASSARAFAVCILGWFLHGVLLFAFVKIAI
jgi:hypothetical protein